MQTIMRRAALCVGFAWGALNELAPFLVVIGFGGALLLSVANGCAVQP